MQSNKIKLNNNKMNNMIKKKEILINKLKFKLTQI